MAEHMNTARRASGRPRILIVEDEYFSSSLLSSYIARRAECVTMRTGDEACAAFEASLRGGPPFDLVFLDIMLPGRDGYSVLREFRRLEAEAGVKPGDGLKVVITSALSEAEILEKVPPDWIFAFIPKPSFKSRVEDIIERLLGDGEGGPPPLNSGSEPT